MFGKLFIYATLGGIVLLSSGCVRRTLTINTEPQGALLWLNDEEIGRTPVSVDFLWYGDYDVVARLDGYQTLTTHHEVECPWYELPGIDLVAEALYPGRIHDTHTMEFALEPAEPADREGLLERAKELRAQISDATE